MGKPKLSDEQVGWLRENPERLTLKERAERLGIDEYAARRAAMGVTYRRLNLRFTPRI